MLARSDRIVSYKWNNMLWTVPFHRPSVSQITNAPFVIISQYCVLVPPASTCWHNFCWSYIFSLVLALKLLIISVCGRYLLHDRSRLPFYWLFKRFLCIGVHGHKSTMLCAMIFLEKEVCLKRFGLFCIVYFNIHSIN